MKDTNQKDKYQNYFDNDKYNENNYYQNQNNTNQNQKNNQGYFSKIDKDRKIALLVLGAFSVFIIVIFFINLNNAINDPFVIRDPNRPSRNTENTTFNQNTDLICTGPNCFADSDLVPENLDLKLIDTDGDGISDWDELFIYGTSPYLEDTSGDGITDYEAIFVYGIDPLCQKGQDCSSDSSFINNNGSLNLLNSLEDNSSNINIPSQISEEELLEYVYNVPPSEIRLELVKAGIDQDSLDLISDEEIMEIYRESLQDIDFSQIQQIQ